MYYNALYSSSNLIHNSDTIWMRLMTNSSLSAPGVSWAISAIWFKQYVCEDVIKGD